MKVSQKIDKKRSLLTLELKLETRHSRLIAFVDLYAFVDTNLSNFDSRNDVIENNLLTF